MLRVPKGRPLALVKSGRRYYRKDDAEQLNPVEPDFFIARARYRDVDGRTRKVEQWAQTRAKAEKALKESMIDRQVLTGSTITSDSRMSALIKYWVDEHLEASKRAPNTKARYKIICDQYLVPRIGELYVYEVTVGLVNRVLARIANETGSPTAQLCKSVWSLVMATAVDLEAAPSNAVRDAKQVEVSHKEVRALKVAEVHELRADILRDEKATAVDLHHLVDMMLATGCRVGEVLAIREQDLSLLEGTVAITGTVVRVTGEGLFRQDTTKGGKPLRLHLPASTLKMLESRLPIAAEAEDGLIFPNVFGGLREVTTVDRQWREFRKRNPRWEGVTPHTFRKTVATLLKNEVGLDQASGQLGHSSTQITSKHYVEAPDVAPDMTSVLSKLLI